MRGLADKIVVLGRATIVVLGLDPRTHVADASLPMASYVYILASRKNGTLYIGVTTDLVRRAHEHRQGAAEGFARRYDVKRLVYFETHDDIRAAIQRKRH